MQLFRIPINLVFLISLGLTACGAVSPQVLVPAPTATTVTLLTNPEQATTEALEATSLDTPVLTSTLVLTEVITPEPTVTNTLVATVDSTPAPTPESEPVVKVDEASAVSINVRAGPGTNYPILSQFGPGEGGVVTGRNEDSSWWQVVLPDAGEGNVLGWIFAGLVIFSGDNEAIPIAEALPPPPPPTPDPNAVVEADTDDEDSDEDQPPPSPEELVEQLHCGKDFCVTYQAMLPIWENGGCVGNHSIYITVLQGLPPGKPMDGVVIGDTFNNVEVGSGSHGPGRTEITLWSNSMTLIAKRNMDGTPYTSEESFNFTSHDELIPPEVLAANGYCDGDVEKCRWAHQNNQVCRGHYSWRVTFHKFD